MENQSIGVFDSGIGGLTVLKALALSYPNESFYYLGDTARLPYGTKTRETIRHYGEQIMNHLIRKKVKAIVIACNSVSSCFSEASWCSVPVFNVILPGSQAALNVTKNFRIGVLGTRATIESGAYDRAIANLCGEEKSETLRFNRVEIFSQACPLLVSLAEEGWENDSITEAIVKRYLEPLLKKKVDTIILGCTHYPLLYDSIKKVVGDNVNLVDSGKSLAEIMRHQLLKGTLQSSTPFVSGEINLFMTDYSIHTKLLAKKILGDVAIKSMGHIELESL